MAQGTKETKATKAFRTFRGLSRFRRPPHQQAVPHLPRKRLSVMVPQASLLSQQGEGARVTTKNASLRARKSTALAGVAFVVVYDVGRPRQGLATGALSATGIVARCGFLSSGRYSGFGGGQQEPEASWTSGGWASRREARGWRLGREGGRWTCFSW